MASSSLKGYQKKSWTLHIHGAAFASARFDQSSVPCGIPIGPLLGLYVPIDDECTYRLLSGR